jgi:hypothetical protein
MYAGLIRKQVAHSRWGIERMIDFAAGNRGAFAIS